MSPSQYPHYISPNMGLGECLLISGVVYLLCLLFNAYRLGKFKKPKHKAPPGSLPKIARKQMIFLVCGLLFAGLAGLALWLLL